MLYGVFTFLQEIGEDRPTLRQSLFFLRILKQMRQQSEVRRLLVPLFARTVTLNRHLLEVSNV